MEVPSTMRAALATFEQSNQNHSNGTTAPSISTIVHVEAEMLYVQSERQEKGNVPNVKDPEYIKSWSQICCHFEGSLFVLKYVLFRTCSSISSVLLQEDCGHSVPISVGPSDERVAVVCNCDPGDHRGAYDRHLDLHLDDVGCSASTRHAQ
jgi:hypothetical protein